MEVRPADRLGDMVALQKLASRLWPAGIHHPGGLGWALAIDQAPANLLVAVENGELVGWAGQEEGTVEVHVAAERPSAATALLDAELAEVDAAKVGVMVVEGDGVVADLAGRLGFRPDPARPPIYGMFHDAGVDPAPVPAGYRIRGLASGEEAARVDAHQVAWRPARMPFPAETLRSVPAEATSRFTHDHFAAAQRAWLYDPELDLVVEASDGTLAGCCTLWWDPALGVAEIEPLGVAPAHRRRGLATALCLTAAGLVGRRGGHEVFINTGPRDDYPVPAVTYAGAGFTTVERAAVWTAPTTSGDIGGRPG